MYQCLDIRHRKVEVVVPGKSPRNVDRGQRHVESELDRGFLARLTVGQSRELLRVAQQELDLEPHSVSFDKVFRRHLGVGREGNTI